jgi:cysteine synthase A
MNVDSTRIPDKLTTKSNLNKYMSIAANIVDTVGNTPLIKLNSVSEGLDCEIFVKAEFFNPLFSVKDRIGKAMIEAAEKDGSLKPGGTIVEATSGNTGIALAFVARAKGYKCILTMPETMSIERRILLRSLGAEIVLTPGPRGMGGAIAKAKQILAETENSFGPSQFDNPANPQVHRDTTAEEIWRDTDGNIDAIVAGVGTGGTITGVGEVIKKRNPNFKVIAVEPENSPVIGGGSPGPHKIQGIGAGFIPGNLNTAIIDEAITVTNEEAFEMAQKLAQLEGIPAGISTGANVASALKIAARDEFKGKRIVTIGCSSTERYLSTPLAESYREEVANLPVAELSD